MHSKYGQRTILMLCGLFVTLVLLSGTLIIVAGGTATAATTTPVDTPSDTEPNGTRIQEGLLLLDRGHTDGTATVTLYVESTTAVTLADAGMTDEGEIRTRTVVLQPGTHTVSLDVTDGGPIAVSLSTSETLYNIPIRGSESISLIGGPWDGQDVQMGALGGAASVAFCVIFVAIRTLTGRADSPERIA